MHDATGVYYVKYKQNTKCIYIFGDLEIYLTESVQLCHYLH
jgi:hypothetical protein